MRQAIIEHKFAQFSSITFPLISVPHKIHCSKRNNDDIQSIILGIVQGLTEFMPISSSAHLVLVPYWLSWKFPAEQIFVFDVLVQLGTLLAVIIYFWKDLVTIIRAVIHGLMIRKPFEDVNARLGWMVVLATIPAGIAGLFLKKLVEECIQFTNGNSHSIAWNQCHVDHRRDLWQAKIHP